MARERVSKELTVGRIGNYTIKVGTTNVNDPRTVYVNIHGSIPKDKVTNIYGRVNEMKAAVRSGVNRIVASDARLDDRFLCDFQINEDGLLDGKRKVVNIEFFVRQDGSARFDDISESVGVGAVRISEMLTKYEDGKM